MWWMWEVPGTCSGLVALAVVIAAGELGLGERQLAELSRAKFEFKS